MTPQITWGNIILLQSVIAITNAPNITQVEIASIASDFASHNTEINIICVNACWETVSPSITVRRGIGQWVYNCFIHCIDFHFLLYTWRRWRKNRHIIGKGSGEQVFLWPLLPWSLQWSRRLHFYIQQHENVCVPWSLPWWLLRW